MAFGDKLKFWKKQDDFSTGDDDFSGGEDGLGEQAGLPPADQQRSGVDDYFAQNDVSGDFPGAGPSAPSLNVGSPQGGQDHLGLDQDQTGLPPSDFDHQQDPSMNAASQGYTDPAMGAPTQTTQAVTNTPFEATPKTPGQAMAHEYIRQQQPSEPVRNVTGGQPQQQVQQPGAHPSMEQTLEMLHLKIDAIRSELTTVHQRMVKIEQILDGQQQKRRSW